MVVFLTIVAGTIASCGPTPAQGRHDPWFDDDDAPPMISGNTDEAEKRWRRDIEADRGLIARERANDPDALLTDDPPKDPDEYGNVAFDDEKPPPAPTTAWGKFKAGMNKVGRASFAAMTVIVTVGMMVAPYLLL